MPETLRGADIVIRTLEQRGVARVFTLSGNHIMSLFDAALGRSIDLVHVRHGKASFRKLSDSARFLRFGQCSPPISSI
jgi:acetolactate synthase I/II/III large subunit